MSDPTDAADPALPPSLRFLKWLVILLMLTLIAGVITIVVLLVTRMPQAFPAQAPTLPPGLALPGGAEAAAVTFGKGWIVVVTEDDHILVYSDDGTLRQDVRLAP